VLEGDERTFQQQKHDPKKITKPAEEEWNQSDLWLANYAQNSHQTLLLKMYSEHVRSWNRYVRSHRIYPLKVSDMSSLSRNFFLNFDS
jgi:hypothetical protein